MNSKARRTTLAASIVLVLVASGVAWVGSVESSTAPPPAYELVALPAGLDTLTSLAEASGRIEACTQECAAIIYVWSPRMPLSRSAIPNIAAAADEVGAALTLVGFEDVERFAESGDVGTDGAALGSALLSAGVLAHAPALVVHDGQRVLGPAILGYKSSEAYASMIAARLAGTDHASLGRDGPGPTLDLPTEVTAPAAITDFPAVGVPGAYFRWVPGRRAVAYESRRTVYLLDLDDGESRVAPGTIDFVPTPDGRYFVTPGQVGLDFYDADRVFEASATGVAGSVRPVHTDPDMRDQYPSIGILADSDEVTRYRVLTSWFQGLRYRDYDVAHAPGSGPPTVRPLGPSVVPCAGMGLSTPIMNQDGTEVAAREEATGTTKIYRFLDDGRCEEVVGLGMPTRKVAWHASGRRLAFSTPRVRTDGAGGAEPGIFLYDRDERRVWRVAESEEASQLAFPDFVGEDGLIFMVPGQSRGQGSFFRLVQPLP